MAHNPFPHGAAYSKDEIIRGIVRPSSDVWADLMTSKAYRRALEDRPDERLRRKGLLCKSQNNEEYLPAASSPKVAYNTERKDSGKPGMPAMKQRGITYDEANSMQAQQPSSMTPVQSLSADPATSGSVAEQLDESNTFTFDLRNSYGIQDFQDWMDEPPEGFHSIRKMSFQHWTWMYNEEASAWSAVDDESTFFLTSDGIVDIAMNKTLRQQPVCHCDNWSAPKEEDDEVDTSGLWSMADFARALVQDDTELLDLASEFVDSVEEHKEAFEAICCEICNLPMFYTRVSRERQIELEAVPEPVHVRCPSPSPPPIPPRSAARPSRMALRDEYEDSDQQVCGPSEEYESNSDHDQQSRSPAMSDIEESLIPLRSESLAIGASASEVASLSSSSSHPILGLSSPYRIRSIFYEDLPPSDSSSNTEGSQSSSSVASQVSTNVRDSLTTSSSTPRSSLASRLSARLSTVNLRGLSDNESRPGDHAPGVAAASMPKRSLAHRLSTRFSSMNLRGGTEHSLRNEMNNPVDPSAVVPRSSASSYTQQLASARNSGGFLKGRVMDKLMPRK